MNRKFDNLGRISIPKEMRDKLGLGNGSEAKIELAGDKIIISNPDKFDLKEYIEEQLRTCGNMDKETAYADILVKIKESE